MFGKRGDPAGQTGKGPLEIQTREMALTEVHTCFLCKSQSVTRNEAIRKHDLFVEMLIDQLLK